MTDESLDLRFTRFLLESQALKFGDFTLKSGRKSPYFINAGAFNDGGKIARLAALFILPFVKHRGGGKIARVFEKPRQRTGEKQCERAEHQPQKYYYGGKRYGRGL